MKFSFTVTCLRISLLESLAEWILNDFVDGCWEALCNRSILLKKVPRSVSARIFLASSGNFMRSSSSFQSSPSAGWKASFRFYHTSLCRVLDVCLNVLCISFPIVVAKIFDGVQNWLINFSLSGVFHWALFNWFGISRDACVWHVLLWIVDGCWYGRVHSRSPCNGGLFCCVKLYNFWPGDRGARPAKTTVTPSAIRLKMKNLLFWAITKGNNFFYLYIFFNEMFYGMTLLIVWTSKLQVIKKNTS